MRTRKLTLLALGLLWMAPLSLAGCAEDPATSSGDEHSTGSIELSLRLPNGRTIDSAAYAIKGPRNFSKTGPLDVSASNGISGQIGGLPAGTGYSIAISATSSDGGDHCHGSVTFGVKAGHTVGVIVSVACPEDSRTGSVMVDGVLSVCPVIDGIGMSPVEVNIGATIALAALAHDSDAGPRALSYAWTASSGILSDASSKNASLTCVGPGTVVLDLTVGDGDSSCATHETAEVFCSIAPEAGAGGAGSGGQPSSGGAAGGGDPVNGCTEFVDRTAAGASRVVPWDFGITSNPLHCLRVRAGQAVVFEGSFSVHPLGPSGGDLPNPITGGQPADAQAFTIGFSSPGTFGYKCLAHSSMIGAVDVVP